MGGLPVTRAERTLADLCLDCEDPSLVEGAFRDAAAKGLSSTLRSLAACSTSSAKTNGERPCSNPSQEPSPHLTRKADYEEAFPD